VRLDPVIVDRLIVYKLGDDDTMLRQGISQPFLLECVSVMPGLPQPLHRPARPQIARKVMASIRDQAYALVVLKRRLVLWGRYLSSQIRHRPDLHESVLDQEQVRISRGRLTAEPRPAHHHIMCHVAVSW
jgi:hypothetical protein